MSDTILNWATNPATRKMMSVVGLPTPQPLKRADGPWSETPMEDTRWAVSGGALGEQISGVISSMGGSPVESFGEDENAAGLVFDATQFGSVADLRAL